MRGSKAVIAGLTALAAIGLGGPLRAETGTLSVELNKLEPIENGCRTFFLFRNRMENVMQGFEMSIAILDRDGIIDRLLTIDAAPLPAGRTTLKLFEIPEIGCERIGAILLHEITTCELEGGGEADCFDFIELKSKASAALVM